MSEENLLVGGGESHSTRAKHIPCRLLFRSFPSRFLALNLKDRRAVQTPDRRGACAWGCCPPGRQG
jgi:hypothetical protein